MAQAQATSVPSDVRILNRLIHPENDDWSAEAARSILKIQFDRESHERMHELAAKAREGTLTALEQAELDSYRRVGTLLGVLWSKARTTLKRAGLDAPDERGS